MNNDKAGTWSPWSLIALACSVGLCPAVTMLGVVFGIVAIRDVKTRSRRGFRVAIAAIIIGLVVTPLTTIGLVWWNSVVREPMLTGPLKGLQAAQDGDVTVLLDEFEAGIATAKEASDFVRRMTNRYGTLKSIHQDPEREAVWSSDNWAISVPYVLTFSGATVKGEGHYIVMKIVDGRQQPVFGFSWIQMGENPRLIFPRSINDSKSSGTERRDDSE